MEKITYQRRIDVKLTKYRKIANSYVDILQKFDDTCIMKNLSISTRLRYINDLYSFFRFYNKRDIKNLKIEDVERYILDMYQRDYKPRTIHGRITSIKILLKRMGRKDIYKYIEKPKIREEPYKLLSKDEVKRLIKCTDNLMDKAIIAILYETACRCGELRGIKIKDITFDTHGAIIMLNGKTGYRPIRMVEFVNFIDMWLFDHKFKKDERSYLFYSLRGQEKKIKYAHRELSHAAISQKLIRAAKRAKLENKDINPHNFRHSRFTELGHYLSDRELKAFGGWKTTYMVDIYNHIVSKDLDEAVLKKVYNIKAEA